MAAGGLDLTTHGVVLLPCPAFDSWVTALTETAAEGGLSLVPYAGGDAPESEPKTVLLLFDAAHAAALPPRNWTVIATGLDRAATAAADRYDLPPEQGVWVASRLLSGACALLHSRWIVDADLSGESLELLPGWRVTPPVRPSATTSDPAAVALELFAGGPPGPGVTASWHPDLFSYDRRRPALGPEPRWLNLTGTARILVFGPYISLPAGLWRAILAFSVDDAGARRQYRVEWGNQADFSFHQFRPGAAGLFKLEIEHRWAATGAAEMRLVLEESVIDGALTFEGLQVERLG